MGAREAVIPGRKPKRARKTTNPNTARRKRMDTMGQKGALKTIMQMPEEIFMEIASHLQPEDILFLIRTNKFFRKLLLRRSTIHIWQRVLNNVPGLPACPADMSQPQYAALLFSQHCTFCGTEATSLPDAYIRVRLCNLCRKTKIATTTYSSKPEHQLVAATRFPTHFPPRGGTCVVLPTYCIREEAQKMAQRRTDFLNKGDESGFEIWKHETLQRLQARLTEAWELLKYICSEEHRLWEFKRPGDSHRRSPRNRVANARPSGLMI